MIIFMINTYAQFKISGEFRTRGEINNGLKNIPDSNDITGLYVSQRTRIKFSYKNEKYETKISIQDVRAWGSENISSMTGVWGNSAGIDVHEAWVDLKLWNHSNLKIGRQELKYDDMRMLSWRNWNQYGLTYDALVYKFKKSEWSIDLGLSLNNRQEKMNGANFGCSDYYIDYNRMKTMDYFYLKKQFNDNLYVSYTSLGAGFLKQYTSTTIYMTVNNALHINYKNNKFDLKTNGIIQNGKSAIGKDINAFLISFDAGYKIKKFRLGAGFSVLSGNDASDTTTNYFETDHAFNLLYGTRKSYFGWMNMFTTPATTANGGVVDVYGNLCWDITKVDKLNAFYHFFALQNIVADYTVNTIGVYFDKKLGSEIDVNYCHNFSKEIQLDIFFTTFLPSKTMNLLKGVDEDNSVFTCWSGIMLTVKPTFFISK